MGGTIAKYPFNLAKVLQLCLNVYFWKKNMHLQLHRVGTVLARKSILAPIGAS